MTKKVTCTLPNASEEINGIPFEAVDGVAVASGLSDEDAAQFEGIPGYAIQDDADEPQKMTAAEKKAAAKAKKAAEDEVKAAEEALAAATDDEAKQAAAEKLEAAKAALAELG